ncbi:MAG: hypothetical protein OQL19_14830 [Gammaproteobacteria bacterium]|nr:hypothetical protein [Gammaproteobacteria bacterium]
MKRDQFIKLTLSDMFFIMMLIGYGAWIYSIGMIIMSKTNTIDGDVILFPFICWLLGGIAYTNIVTPFRGHIIRFHLTQFIMYIGGFIWFYFMKIRPSIK